MASSPDAPAPTDTVGAARATSSSNLNLANLATMANRVNTNNQNGSVKYSYTDQFDSGAYNRAIADWQRAGSKQDQMPQVNDYYQRQWTQNETLNPALQETLANNQLADKVLSGAAQSMAMKAKSSLNNNFSAPQLSNYLKNVPALDKTKINQVKAYDSNAKLSTDLAGGLDRLNVADNKQVGKFTSNGTNLDTNFADNAAKAGSIKDFAQQAAKFNSTSKIDTNVNDNLAGVGKISDVGTKVGSFKTGAKIDTNVNDNLKNVGSVDQYNGMNNAFSTKAKVDTNVNDNLAGVKALNQDGAKQMSDFKFNGPQVQNQIQSNAKLDTNLNDNLARNGVDMSQQQFTDNGDRVKTNSPKFDERTADKYARAAYEAQMAFQRGDMERDVSRASNKLALQGLGVDSSASRDAMGTIYDSQAKARNQLSNQAVLTGANVANQNYASQLAGFQAGNAAELQRFQQNQGAFQQNLAANAQAFNQNAAAFNQNNAANQAQFENDATRAQFANSAQNQAFNQAQAGYQNTLAGRQLNQQIIDSTNNARNAAFEQATNKFQLNNAAAAQQFSQDNAAYQNQLAMNSQNSALVAARNAAQNQRYDQATNNFQLNNVANQTQFGLDQTAYQQGLAAQAQQANLVSQNNQAQQARYSQATNNFQLNNAANQNKFAQDATAYQNNLAGIAQNLAINQNNNANQNNRFTQALAGFNATNDARNAQFGQNQSAFNTNMQGTMNNANLKTLDNQNAMLQQSWKANNLNFANQAKMQQETLNQQDFQNQIQAQAANMNLRNANNDIQSQALAQAYQRYGTDYTAAETARYRPLNDYVALTNQTAVSPTTTYQPYATQGTSAGTDYLGASQAAQQQALAKYNAGVASANSTNQSIAGLAQMAAMAFMMSDKNLKTNVEKIGETDSGRNVYSWDWNKKAEKLGLSGSSEGVIAQQNPDISKRMSNGFLAVDYSRIHEKKKSK